MKFTLNTHVALAVFSQALKTCNTKSKGQPDSEFLFEKDGDKLTVTSLNEISEQCISVPTVSLTGDDEKFSVAGAAVVEFLRQISDSEVACGYSTKNNAFVMATTDPSKQTKFAFPVGDPTDFIPIQFKSIGVEFDISGEAFSNALKCTAFAAATDGSQTPQTAVRMRVYGEMLVAEASDYHRISMYTSDIEEVDIDNSFLLRKDVAETLSSLLVDLDSVKVVRADNHIRFIWGDTVFTSVLESEIKKKFAPVSKFFSGKLLGEAKLSRGELQRALKLASLIAKESSVGVALDGSHIVITTNEDGKGISKDTVITQTCDGEASTYSAWKYLVKAVDTAFSPWITMEFRELPNAAGVALVIIDEGYQHLIFPVLPKANDATDDATP